MVFEFACLLKLRYIHVTCNWWKPWIRDSQRWYSVFQWCSTIGNYLQSSASNASLRETIADSVTRLVLKKLHWPLFDAPLQTLDSAFRSWTQGGFNGLHNASHSFEPSNDCPSLVVSFSSFVFPQAIKINIMLADKTCHLPGREWWQPYCIGLNMEGQWVKEEHERSK